MSSNVLTKAHMDRLEEAETAEKGYGTSQTRAAMLGDDTDSGIAVARKGRGLQGLM